MAFQWFKFREQKGAQEVKPFLDHLEDLRWMLLKMVVALFVSMLICFCFRGQLMTFAERPLYSLGAGQEMVTLMAIGVADSMTISFTLAFYAGLVLAFPFLIYFLAEFILPALTKKERALVWPAVAVSFGLFLMGVIFCFQWILPLTLRFFANDASRLGLRPSWTIDQYFSFVTNFTLAFGLSFEMPVAILALVKLDLVDYDFLKRTRKYAVIIILVIAMFIAPPDLLTMLALAAPMLVLYESCIWLSRWMRKTN